MIGRLMQCDTQLQKRSEEYGKVIVPDAGQTATVTSDINVYLVWETPLAVSPICQTSLRALSPKLSFTITRHYVYAAWRTTH